MKKILLILVLTNVMFVQAQDSTQTYFAKNHFWGLNVAAAKNEFTPSIYWIKQHAFGKEKRLRLGYGLRFTGYFASNVPYQTAPAIYTSGQRGPQVFFADNIPANIDTLLFKTSTIGLLNVSINIEYKVYKRIALAFNIDASGFSFGPKKQGIHNQSGVVTQAKPTTGNLLLVSDNDIGSLNSEFLIKYYMNNHFALVGGFGFLFTEYTTDKNFKLGNDRFRNKSEQLTLGFIYTPFKTF